MRSYSSRVQRWASTAATAMGEFLLEDTMGCEIRELPDRYVCYSTPIPGNHRALPWYPALSGEAMKTALRVEGEITEDGHLVVDLPPELPRGRVVVTLELMPEDDLDLSDEDLR